MPNTVLLDQVVYQITSDPEAIRHLGSYQKVRDEINSRFNPLSGGTNWQEVYGACELLAKGPGVDLLMASYFTIAKLKVEGLAGYANGLELLLQSLLLLAVPDSKSAKMRKEVLDWVNNKAVVELKNIKPTQEHLRDLYRSERMCERIHHCLTLQQPEVKVDFEAVGFVLFEHIDQIETRYHTAIKRQEKQQENLNQVSRKRYQWSLLATCLSTAVISTASLWLYFNPSILNEHQFKQNVEVPLLTSENLESYLEHTKPSKLSSVQSELVPMYQSSIEEKTHVSIEQPYLKAMEQLSVLEKLYGGDEQVTYISQSLHHDQQLALQQADEFVARFGEIRTKMANIALLAKKRRWAQVANETKSLEDFAVSLSPIYGRVGYVESLIDSQQYQQAQQEFDELKRRLNNLSWKVAQLNQKLAE